MVLNISKYFQIYIYSQETQLQLICSIWLPIPKHLFEIPALTQVKLDIAQMELFISLPQKVSPQVFPY